jgi:hypothetical protein
MPVKQYALANVTLNKENVTVSAPASDSTNGVRVIVDDGIVTSEQAVLLALEAISQRIREDTWPPTAA